MADWTRAIKAVLLHEGGITNDPADKGGLTHYGITQVFLDDYAPGVTVAEITSPDVASLYYRRAWDRWQYDLLVDDAVAAKIFDSLVLCGSYWAHRCAQDAATLSGHPCDRDGVIGPHTRAAINASSTTLWMPAMIAALEEHFNNIVDREPSQERFLTGWLNRARWDGSPV